jgi:hypothetical protein
MKIIMKKFIFLVLTTALVFAVLPLSSVYAAPLSDDPTPQNEPGGHPKIEKGFARVKSWYEKQSQFLEKAEQAVSKAQNLIIKANQKGLDASAVQTALDVFKSRLVTIQAAHDKAGLSISTHNGFDENGKVVDAKIAAQTVKDASAALQEGRQARQGAGKTLREAIRAFIQANKPPRPANGNTEPAQP